MLNFKMLV